MANDVVNVGMGDGCDHYTVDFPENNLALTGLDEVDKAIVVVSSLVVV
jgi:hypothetical protein